MGLGGEETLLFIHRVQFLLICQEGSKVLLRSQVNVCLEGATVIDSEEDCHNYRHHYLFIFHFFDLNL